MGLRVLARKYRHFFTSRLHVWACGTEFELAGQEVTSISLGISNLVTYSQDGHKLQFHSLTSAKTIPNIQLSLPAEVKCEGNGIKMVSSGLAHSLLLSNSGRVYSCGLNYFGQTGRRLSGEETAEECVGGWQCARAMTELRDVKQVLLVKVVCGLDHSLFLSGDGTVSACGWASDGQTGCGSYENTFELNQVDLSGKRASFLASCADSSFAITDDGCVFGWGNNEYGQLGVASVEPQLSQPHLVDTSILDSAVTSVAAGGPFTGFLTVHGSVYVCGYPVEQGSDIPQSEYYCMRKLHDGQKDGKIKVLSAGLNYLLALRYQNSGLIWGRLELPHCSRQHHSPSQFVLDSGIIALACGHVGVSFLSHSNTSFLALQ